MILFFWPRIIQQHEHLPENIFPYHNGIATDGVNDIPSILGGKGEVVGY